jgi:hypothetical protein
MKHIFIALSVILIPSALWLIFMPSSPPILPMAMFDSVLRRPGQAEPTYEMTMQPMMHWPCVATFDLNPVEPLQDETDEGIPIGPSGDLPWGIRCNPCDPARSAVSGLPSCPPPDPERLTPSDHIVMGPGVFYLGSGSAAPGVYHRTVSRKRKVVSRALSTPDRPTPQPARVVRVGAGFLTRLVPLPTVNPVLRTNPAPWCCGSGMLGSPVQGKPTPCPCPTTSFHEG